MTLFVPQPLTSTAGVPLTWKIECDALTDDDWRCLASMAASVLVPFHAVHGIPRGGLPFAEALREHVDPSAESWLLADDVWTTGKSMLAARGRNVSSAGYKSCVGVVAFSRSREPLPDWVTPVLSVHPEVAP